jgi:hypothetical protein
MSFAQRLFDMTKIGMRVIVARNDGLAKQMLDQSNPSSFNERCTAGRAFMRSK